MSGSVKWYYQQQPYCGNIVCLFFLFNVLGANRQSSVFVSSSSQNIACIMEICCTHMNTSQR